MARPRKGQEKDRPVHLGFRVTKETDQALRRIAGERGIPMSDVAHEALVAYLKRRGVSEAKKQKAKKQ